MRSVILKPSERCPRCQLPLRWCVCAAHRAVVSPLQVDVLTHHRERHRPSSTGNLIHRVVTGARHHEWRRERQLSAADVRVGNRELWILHPQGEPAPAGGSPEEVQLLLLDGSWREASAMAQEVRGWGRPVSLPMEGESRYWLRSQADAKRFSTVEALLFLFQRFNLRSGHDTLRLQFELHVYASLRARGQKASALEFLATSPITEIFPEFIAQLDVRRPR
ncbi:MAG: DTW domain-containing protein [Opitutaceae bacterium]